MTGKDIVEALSFVDERYIEEAEHGTIPKTNNLRYLLPLAACLCLVLLGLRFRTPAPESAPEAAIETNSASMHRPEMSPDLEIMEMHKDSSVIVESDVPVEGIMEPEMGEAHSVILRIVSWTDQGAAATVERYLDAEFVPLGTLLNLKMCVEEAETDAESLVQFREQFPEGSLIRVRYVYYSEEYNILYIESVSKEAE